MRCVSREPPGVSARHIRAFTRTRTRTRARSLTAASPPASRAREREESAFPPASLPALLRSSRSCRRAAGLSLSRPGAAFVWVSTQGATHPLRPREASLPPPPPSRSVRTRVCISPNNTPLPRGATSRPLATSWTRGTRPTPATKTTTTTSDHHHHTTPPPPPPGTTTTGALLR